MFSLESTGEWGSATLLHSHCISLHCPFSFPSFASSSAIACLTFFICSHLADSIHQTDIRYLLVFAEKFSIFWSSTYWISFIYDQTKRSTQGEQQRYMKQEERTDLHLLVIANYESSQQPNSSFLSKGGRSTPFMHLLTSSSFFLPCSSCSFCWGTLCWVRVSDVSASQL